MHIRRQLRGASVVALVLLTPSLVLAAPAGGTGPEDLFDQALPAQSAITRLGGSPGRLASANPDLDADSIAHLLQDPTTWADRQGRLFVVDPTPAPATTAAADPVLDAPFGPEMAFELESRPGALRTIYLDFDGATVSGTAWNANYTAGNAFFAEAFSSDVDGSTFSDSERAIIQSVWRRVAEDYAPFDVNVTTKDPGDAAITRSGSTDQQYGTRVLITNTTTVYSSCGCGGVAYVGTFDYYSSGSINHAYYQPAFVFQRGLGANAKNLAEAASHEAGHNLGLGHDGTSTSGYYTGHGSWAPIMGVGYYKAITQWSRGEYADASNAQDDYAVIQANGGPLMADDHGDSAATATPLVVGDIDGLISTPGDVDVFEVSTTGGTLSLTASPSVVSPNLDIRLELRDQSGSLVAVDDPASGSTGSDNPTGMGASISADVPAGVYTVSVDGVGVGNPATTGYSDWGSLGRYRLTAGFAAGGQPPTAVVTATPASGTAPVAVAFDGSASSDSDGQVVSWTWAFGDGASATGVSANHTYTAPGVYTATLTVTDDAGLSDTATSTISVAAAATPVDVATISVTGSSNKRGTTATATVAVTDLDGVAAVGVTVSGAWTLIGTSGTTALGTSSGTTSTAGTFSVNSPRVTASTGDVFRFTITGVNPPTGMIHDDSVFQPSFGEWTVSATGGGGGGNGGGGGKPRR